MGNQSNPFNKLSNPYKLPNPYELPGDYNNTQRFSVAPQQQPQQQQPQTNLDFSHINPSSLNPYMDTAKPEETKQQPPVINQQPRTNLDFSHINPESLKKYYGKKVKIDPALKKQLIKRGMYDKLNELEYPQYSQDTTTERFAKNITNIPGDYIKESFLPTLNKIPETISGYFKESFLPAVDQVLRTTRAGAQLASTPIAYGIASTPALREIDKVLYGIDKVQGGDITYSDIAQTNFDMAKKMFSGEAKWGDNVKKAGRTYLSNRGVGAYGDNPIELKDIAVISALGFFNFFGDPFLEATAFNRLYQGAKEAVLWKKVGQIKKQLPVNVIIKKPQSIEIPIAKDLKIKIEPFKSEIKIKGFAKRNWKGGEIVPPNKLIGSYSDAVNDLTKIIQEQTGAKITGIIKGNDLILQPTLKTQVISSQAGFAKLPAFKQLEKRAKELEGNIEDIEISGGIAANENIELGQIRKRLREMGEKDKVDFQEKVGDITGAKKEEIQKGKVDLEQLKPLAKATKKIRGGEEISMTEEDYLSSRGASRLGYGEPALHKNIKEDRAKRKALDKMVEKNNALTEKREKLRLEYAQKIKSGEIRKPTRIEKLINTASGMEELESVQAARRLLKKSGIDWRKAKPKEEFGSLVDVVKKKQNDLVKILRGTKGMTADDITKKYPNIQLKRDVFAKDIHGNKVKIPEGEKLTPYELKRNKILLQDGQTYIVSKNQFQNIKGNSVGGEAKPFAPELKGSEESVLKKPNEEYARYKELYNKLKTKKIEELTPIEQKDWERLKNTSGISRGDTKFFQYTLSGGKNYREILIKAPKDKTIINQELKAEKLANEWRIADSNNEFLAYGKTKTKALNNAKRILEELKIENPRLYSERYNIKPYKSSHWDEPNVLSHLRMNDRTYKGKKVVFMEELQSDWAKDLRDEKTKATNPLLKNWQKPTIKRALQDAVNNNADYFAWINGEQTSARYNLATQVEKISWEKMGNGAKTIFIKPKDGGNLIEVGIDKKGMVTKGKAWEGGTANWKGKKLDEVLGKGLADKIMSKEKGTLSGEGLKFGGEWATNLYDKQVGNIIKDLTGAEIIKMDMGLPISVKQTDWRTAPKGSLKGSTPLTMDRLKVGERIFKDVVSQNDSYIITEILGDGKFKAVRKEAKEAFEKGDRTEPHKHTFDISQPTTIQQGIKLTPEIKAKIKGKAIVIKTSGQKFKIIKKPKEEFKDLLKITKRKQQPSIITPKTKLLSPKEMRLLLPSAKGHYAGEGFTVKPGKSRTAKQIISSLKKKIASPEKVKYENKLLALREKFVEQLGKEKAKRISIENRKKMLTDYIIEGIPDPEVRKTFVHAVEKVKTDYQLSKQFERVDAEATKINRKRITKQIEKELKATKPKKKRGFLKGKFPYETQKKLNIIRENINNSREVANQQKGDNILKYTKGEMSYNDMMDINAMLDMQGIKEMNLGELKNVLDNIKSIKQDGKSIREKRKLKEQAETQQTKDRFIDIITDGKGIKEGGGSVPREQLEVPRGRIGKTADIVDNWQHGWDNLLDKLSKFDKSSKPYKSDISKFGDKIHRARNEQNSGESKYLTQAKEKAMEIFGEKNILGKMSRRKLNNTLNKMGKEKVSLGSFKNSEGETINLNLTKEQIIQKYQQLKDPTNDGSFDEGMKWTDEIKEAVNKALNQKEKEWADWQLQFYQDYLKTINPVYSKIYNIDLGDNPNYAPAFKDIESEIPGDVLLAQEAARYSSVTNGSLKAKTKNSMPLKFGEADSVLINHIIRMEHFKSWAEPMKDLRRIFGDKDVRTAIRQYHGEKILNILDKFLNQIARDGVDRALINRAADFLRTNFTVSVLGLPKTIIAIKQIPSGLAYITEMPARDFFTGVADFWKNPLENYKTLVKNSPYFTNRFGSGYERDIRFAMQKGWAKQLSSSENFKTHFMSLIRSFDKFTVVQGSWAKYKSELKRAKIMGKKITTQDAIFEAEKSTKRTQPTSELETLATPQRGGSFIKLMTMFFNQPNKYYRIISDNIRNMRYGRISKTKGMSNLLIAWIILPMIFQFIADAFQYKKKHQNRIFYLGPINNLLVAGQLTQSMYSWLTGEPFEAQVSPVFSTLRDLQYALTKARKLVKDGKDPYKDIKTEDVIKMLEYSSLVGGKVFGYTTPGIVQVEKAIRRGEPKEIIFTRYSIEGGKEKKKYKNSLKKGNNKFDFSNIKAPKSGKFDFSNIKAPKSGKFDFSNIKAPKSGKFDFSNIKAPKSDKFDFSNIK